MTGVGVMTGVSHTGYGNDTEMVWENLRGAYVPDATNNNFRACGDGVIVRREVLGASVRGCRRIVEGRMNPPDQEASLDPGARLQRALEHLVVKEAGSVWRGR